MKKVFTLLMVLLIATAGYSQIEKMSRKDAQAKAEAIQKFSGMEELNFVGSIPNMTRSDGELDHTIYDWQTNAGPITRTITWPDGKVNFAFTYAAEANYPNRGTAIGTYNSVTDEWIPCNGRVENERTGFGSIARYGENGIVLVAHGADDVGVFIIENKDEIPNELAPVSHLGSVHDVSHAAVMTSGENRDIIHVVCALFSASLGNVKEPIFYFRSSDGGQTWDKKDITLPFLDEEHGLNWGSNTYHWMETTENNRLALVINNSWSDGMVIYSDDNGENWERKVFYQHPDIHGNFGDQGLGFLYPRYVSCQWDTEGKLCLAYEYNGTNGDASADGSYYPGLGGVAYWDETLPYNASGNTPSAIPGNLTPGEPFVMDSSYLNWDIHASYWWFSDAVHEMWPEFIGYVTPLDDEGNPEDPYTATAFNINGDEHANHGKYNSGICSFPVLCMVPGTAGEMVVIWSAMDENNKDDKGNYFFKIFANATQDGGRTWLGMKQLTTDFQYAYSEFAYNQATIIDRNLIIAVQMDGSTDTSVMGDDADPSDNLYQGLTFNIDDLWEFNTVEEKPVSNTQISVFPNPVESRMSVTLNQDANVVIYNLTGQVVNSFHGHAGVNNIDITSMNSGVYFISAGNTTQKFVVK